MSRAAEESRRAKRDLIVIDDADEPPMKREPDEPAPSDEVAELRQQLKQSDENFQKLCDVARRDKEALQTRVDYLETLFDSKDGILNKPDNASVEDELKKKLSEVSRELEEERQRSAEQQWKLGHQEKIIDDLTSQILEERNRSALLQRKVNQADAILRPVVQHGRAVMPGPSLGTATSSLSSQRLGRSTAVAASPARKQHQLQPTMISKTLHKRFSSDFHGITKNEYSFKARRFIESYPFSGVPVIVGILKNAPRVKFRVVKYKTRGLFATEDISKGSYIAELCGFVRLQSECCNQNFSPAPWQNDRTFLVEEDGVKLLVDARNDACFVRRSCKPNAELKVLMSMSELHVMIKAKDGVELKAMEEVSIKFDDDWQEHPRPVPECTCKGDELNTCEIELFFSKAFQTATSESPVVDELTSQLQQEQNRSPGSHLLQPGPSLGTATCSMGSQPLGRLTAVKPSPARQLHELQPTVESNQSPKPDVLKPVMVRVQMEKANLNKKLEDIAKKQEFRETLRSEYSAKTRIFISNHPFAGAPAVIPRLRNIPRIESRVVKNRTQGVFATQDIYPGGYIAELCGFVCLQSECSNRYFSPAPWLNDRTFLVEEDGEKLIIDARGMGNSARFVRRSCKPNAELKVVISKSGMHVIIKAKEGVEIKAMEEVSIKFDDDWQEHPRPVQECTCKGDELKTCEIELFFSKAFQDQSRVGATSKDN